MRTVLGWLLSLIVVGAGASIVTAQAMRSDSRIVSGGDLGFRIEGTGPAGEPVGSLVIRVNGQWVVPGSSVVSKRVR